MRTSMRPLLVALVATALVPNLLAAQAPTQQSAVAITGTIRSTTGEPIAGAVIAVTGQARGAITRGDGSYRIVLPPGRYEIRARLLGYSAARESVTVAVGQPVQRDFSLERAVTNLEAVAVIGTRGEERTVIDAPVPIDVLSGADIRQMGRTETAQMIQATAPSFNFPRASIGDGTDHMRPASLRGLAPDQVLVLVNGKRRHPGSLVNLNGFVGRGSQPVDLNAIPSSMIDRIEILRDGAAAQYGSDAIAGVINIVLKSRGQGELTTTAGQYVTTYNRADDIEWPAQFEGERKARDGKMVQIAGNRGVTFGSAGFFYAGAEMRDRGETNRTLPDRRQQYFAGDPRNANPAQINHRQGDAYLHDLNGFFNTGTTLASGVELYAFGGLGKRFGDAAGFWRRANDDRTLRNLYPDGFLPLIQSEIWDASLAAGAKGDVRGWQWDLSTVFGRNSFDFTIANSGNVSLGPGSPTRFDAGQLRFAQSTSNLDLFRELSSPWTRPIRLAVGAEFRADMYGIGAGEEASYRNGNVRVLDANGTPTTRLAAVGSQVFPGFTPQDEGDHSRTNVAGYVDVESKLHERLLLGLAARAEHYSDFGSTLTGKVAARFEIASGVALRGAASTGFRAPTLGQEYFTSTATNFINGVPFDIKTLPPTSDAAKVLGATSLEPERSRNLSAGLALEPTRSLSITADYYRIDIDDRIVLSENFTQTAVQNLFRENGFNIGGARYFTNAIDTKTDGIDIVANFGHRFARGGVLRLTGGYNGTWTKVKQDTVETPAQLRGFSETLFGRVERARIETGVPRNNVLTSLGFDVGVLGLTARTQRFGEITIRGSTPTNATGPLDQTFSAKWITDLGASVRYRNRYTLSVGVDNVLDVYPDRNINVGDVATSNGGTANFGIFPYSGNSPFGFNGRFVYTRLSLGL